MAMVSAPRASMVAADAQLSGAATVSRRVWVRSRCTRRNAAIPLPPSDFTQSVSWRCGPVACSSSCMAITSLSQTEPLVDVQYVMKLPRIRAWMRESIFWVRSNRRGGVLIRTRAFFMVSGVFTTSRVGLPENTNAPPARRWRGARATRRRSGRRGLRERRGGLRRRHRLHVGRRSRGGGPACGAQAGAGGGGRRGDLPLLPGDQRLLQLEAQVLRGTDERRPPAPGELLGRAGHGRVLHLADELHAVEPLAP